MIEGQAKVDDVAYPDGVVFEGDHSPFDATDAKDAHLRLVYDGNSEHGAKYACVRDAESAALDLFRAKLFGL